MNTPAPAPSRRRFLQTSFAAAASLPAWAAPLGANSDVRVATIGFRGRGSGHIKELLAIPGVRLVALCDVDQDVIDKRVAELAKNDIKVKTYRDFRECCADKDIDAVTIATPNHSHVLIALTALQHGKHVYVEKPVSHNLLESAKLMAAAKKAAEKGIIVQHGMQRRSDIGWASAMQWVKEGHIGKTMLSHALVHGMRLSIGKVDGPQQPPAPVDYKLWSAPRPEMPIMRKQFHYDWHWQWPYGGGDIGNQGPHQYDVARWALGDPDVLPKRVMSFGNRWGYIDDGQSANCQLAFHPYEPVPLIMDKFGLPMRGLDAKTGEPPYKGIRTGNIIHCEGGYVAESKAYDHGGKTITKFENFLMGPDHMKNFIDSVRAGKYTKDVLHIRHGHAAACLSHMANVSYRVGKAMRAEEVKERLEGDKFGQEIFAEFQKNLANNGIDLAAQPIVAGPWLDYDPATNRFTGEFAAEANKLCEEEYAKGFELPEA
ncbi:MAG: Gfo/Idh/MocA family oxidoreductase [Verrucomicrobiaceae bacterium]|nr:Gfo/Idh/MocA family oxidoreductase [Verrucomicrobiaceae bacterium]